METGFWLNESNFGKKMKEIAIIGARQEGNISLYQLVIFNCLIVYVCFTLKLALVHIMRTRKCKRVCNVVITFAVDRESVLILNTHCILFWLAFRVAQRVHAMVHFLNTVLSIIRSQSTNLTINACIFRGNQHTHSVLLR